MMANWYESLFGNLPLQPVLGVPINPAYQQMPNATAPITDVRGQGTGAWMSRPHDQDIASRNLGGYAKPKTMDQIDYLKNRGWLGQGPPTTPLQDPDYYPDPTITANIKAAQSQGFTSDQIQNALQLWQTGQ